MLPRARAIRAQAAGLGNVPPALVRRACRELDRLEPAIREAGWLRPRLLHGDYGTSNAAAGPAAGGLEVVAVFDFESAAPGDPVEDFLWTADHGLDSPIFQSFLAGYLTRGQLDPGAPERFAFHQLEHCLGILGWNTQDCPEYLAQALWLIEQVLDGAAIDCYERAIVADPQYDKAHGQLIYAMSALGQTDKAIDRYQQRLAAAPADPRAHSFLASAYMLARDYDHAQQVIRAGLELAPRDPALTEQQGDIFAATGHPDDALACWQRAFTLNPDNLSPRYSAAFLLERQDRLAEAAAEWRFIITWCEEHGYAISAEWPRRELQRLEATLAGN